MPKSLLRRPERRRFGRMRIAANASIQHGYAEAPVELIDLSLGGALLRAAPAAHVRSAACRLCIPFGRDPEEAIQLDCRVVQVVGAQLRVEWLQRLSPENARKLRWLMQRALGSLQVVERRVPMLVWPTLSTRR